MNNEITVLRNLGKNVSMGIESCFIIYNMIEDEGLKVKLLTFIEEYVKILNEIDEIFNLLEENGQFNNILDRMRLFFTVMMEIRMNSKTNNIARMLINGNIMGIIDINEDIEQYENMNEAILNISKNLRQIEENNIEELYKMI